MPDGAAVVRYQGRHGTSWRIKFKDATGRQVMQTLGREAEGWTEQKAEREFGKRLPLVHRERWRQPDEITFETFADRFMNEYLPGRNLKPTTIAGYRSSLDNHLLPALGHLPLQDLEARPDLVDTYISEKQAKGFRPRHSRTICSSSTSCSDAPSFGD
ncbi:MAG: N-terminal phage integrase SAM-like domain-containing protein [Actinomycetia bacterium]|nr:N-terminal phage integrase SAM-like domain-containing protein [Actinomycetes bacterium]